MWERGHKTQNANIKKVKLQCFVIICHKLRKATITKLLMRLPFCVKQCTPKNHSGTLKRLH